MSCTRKQRRTTWLALVGCPCIPGCARLVGHQRRQTNLGLHLVASSAEPVPVGEDVTYTATVTTSDSGSLFPTDQVGFLDNGSTITNCNSVL